MPRTLTALSLCVINVRRVNIFSLISDDKRHTKTKTMPPREVSIGVHMKRKLLEQRTQARMSSIIEETERLMKEFACDDMVCKFVIDEWKELVEKNFKGAPVVSKVTTAEKLKDSKIKNTGRPLTAKLQKLETVFSRERVALRNIKSECKFPMTMISERNTPYYSSPAVIQQADIGFIGNGLSFLDGGLLADVKYATSNQPRKYSKQNLQITLSDDHNSRVPALFNSENSEKVSNHSKTVKRYRKRLAPQRSNNCDGTNNNLGIVYSRNSLSSHLDGGPETDIAKPMERPLKKETETQDTNLNLEFDDKEQAGEEDLSFRSPTGWEIVSSDEELERIRAQQIKNLSEPCSVNIFAFCNAPKRKAVPNCFFFAGGFLEIGDYVVTFDEFAAWGLRTDVLKVNPEELVSGVVKEEEESPAVK